MSSKIIYIEAQRLFRKQKHGMDVVALEIIQHLKNIGNGNSITVIVKQDEDICLRSSSNKTVKILQSAFYPFWEQWILPRFIQKNPGVFLHCTGNTAPLWGKIPLVETIHDLIFLEKNNLFKNDAGSLYQRFGNLYRRIIVPIVAKRAKHIITVSAFQRQLIIKQLGVPPDKISVVYNGVDERFFNHADDARVKNVCEKYGIKNFPFIFFLANTDARKNTDGTLKAFLIFCKQYPNFSHKLVLKGLSETQLQKKIIACKAEEISHRIHRIDYIHFDDMPILYQAADIFWFPSFSEGFGLPIIEAMASGTPLITSNTSVMPEIAGDGALYFDPLQPQQLAGLTASLLVNEHIKIDLINKGKLRAAKFTWPVAIDDLIQVYSKLLN